ncbi:F-actin-monooxygenase MICAL3-like [Scyliorhinus canicula]|uniref:F-actin-monooxygenase MICAL3-like n=1 Tax=Scyliorhinus canicula TaxID=7830 RepID=UPI0018F50464|nr:F-actin-monooxygenase MICAL3-like [Scyliorhinus canicula]
MNQEALLNYVTEAASFSTNHLLPRLDFAMNHYGQPDVAMFDFTCMYASENASLIRDEGGKQLLVALVGDSLLEPFWPMGTGIARGFLAAFDAAWMVRSWAQGSSPLSVLAESLFDGKANAVSAFLIFEPLSEPLARSNKLLAWCQRQTQGYKNVSVVDLTTSWKSGLALSAIIHRYRPDLIDFDQLNEKDVESNNQMAFDVAEREFGISPIMTGKEMAAVGEPDKLSMVMYLSQFYEMLKDTAPEEYLLGFHDKSNIVSATKSPISFLSRLGQSIARKRGPKAISEHGLLRKTREKEDILDRESQTRKSEKQDILDRESQTRKSEKQDILDRESQTRMPEKQDKFVSRLQTRFPVKEANYVSQFDTSLPVKQANYVSQFDTSLPVKQANYVSQFDTSLPVKQANYVSQFDTSLPVKQANYVSQFDTSLPVKQDKFTSRLQTRFPVKEDTFTSRLQTRFPVKEDKFTSRLQTRFPVKEDKFTSRLQTRFPVKEDKFTSRLQTRFPVKEDKFTSRLQTRFPVKEDKFTSRLQTRFPVKEDKFTSRLQTRFPVKEDTFTSRLQTRFPVKEDKFTSRLQTRFPVKEDKFTSRLQTRFPVKEEDRDPYQKGSVKSIANQFLTKSDSNVPGPSHGLKRQQSMKKEFPTQFGGSDVCYFCGKRVYVMERLSAEGKFFHRGCFKCAYCGMTLRLATYAYNPENGKFYCKPHYRLAAREARKRPATPPAFSQEKISPPPLPTMNLDQMPDPKLQYSEEDAGRCCPLLDSDWIPCPLSGGFARLCIEMNRWILESVTSADSEC